MKKIDSKKLSEEMEKECMGWENTEGLSEERRKQILKNVMEAEIQKEAKMRFQKEKQRMQVRYIACTIALLVMVTGMGVFGERIWRIQGSNQVQDGHLSTNISTEEQENIMMKDEKMYQEIKDALGIAPMRFGYMPEGMQLEKYQISETTGVAYVEYSYEGKFVYVRMKKSNVEAVGGIQWDGKAQKLELDPEKIMYKIEGYCVDLDNKNYGATIYYGDAYYDIQGKFEDKNIFLEILYGIFFENL